MSERNRSITCKHAFIQDVRTQEPFYICEHCGMELSKDHYETFQQFSASILINKLFAIEPSDAESTDLEEDESSWSLKAVEQFNRAEDLERQLAEANKAVNAGIHAYLESENELAEANAKLVGWPDLFDENMRLKTQLAEAREISAARNAQVSAFEQYSNNLQRELEEERSTDDLEPSCGDCIYYNGEYCSGSPDRFGKNNDSPSCDGFEEKAND